MRQGRQQLSLQRSRPRAALLRVLGPVGLILASLPLLAGCAAGAASPWVDTVGGLLPGADSSVAERAEALSFASLALDTGDTQGLAVLGILSGETSYWPTGANGLVSLHQGGLHATAGLSEDLLHTRYSPLEAPDHDDASGPTEGPTDGTTGYVPWQDATPRPFRLTRLWRTADGQVAGGEARGSLTCGPVEPRELPLATLSLQRCDQRLQWHDGSVTRGTLWRDAETHRLWDVSERPWPGAATFEWRVARPWW